MKCGFLLCFTVIIYTFHFKDAVAAPSPKFSDLLFNVNTGLSDMMKVAKALSKKDYIEALLILIDINLKVVKNHRGLISFSLEESRPALKLLRSIINVFHASEGSEYYALKFNDKMKIVISSWKKSAKESSNIMKRYFKFFVEDVKSGEFKKRVLAFFQKMINKVKKVFRMFFRKRRH